MINEVLTMAPEFGGAMVATPLNEDSVDQFVGGTVYQAFLSATN